MLPQVDCLRGMCQAYWAPHPHHPQPSETELSSHSPEEPTEAQRGSENDHCSHQGTGAGATPGLRAGVATKKGAGALDGACPRAHGETGATPHSSVHSHQAPAVPGTVLQDGVTGVNKNSSPGSSDRRKEVENLQRADGDKSCEGSQMWNSAIL